MTELTVEQSSRHAVYVQRFGGFLSNLFDPYLTRLQKEIRLIMIDAPETTSSMRRINQIVAEWRKASLIVYGEYNSDVLMAQLLEFADDEAAWQVASLNKAIESTAVELTLPATAQVTASVLSNPLIVPDSNDVKLLQPFIRDWEAAHIKKVGDIIRTGFITGRTNNQITQDIAGKNGYLDNQNRKSIKSMVRTSTTHTSNLARQATFDDNSDIVIGYEWVSTLDSRTSSICRSLDGKVFKNNDKNKEYPPAHPNCRSSTAPVLDERFNLDDGPGKRASKGIEKGQRVNADLTYYDWLKGQGNQGPKGRAFVMDILGKERGELFMDGGLTVTKFKQLTIDELFQPIPLKELRKKQSLTLAFDKIDG